MPARTAIRAAIPHDCSAIAALMTQLHCEEGYDAVTTAEGMQVALFAMKRDVQLAALVAVADEGIVGALLYYPGYDTLSASIGYHLADIIVMQSHRQSGIGKALMRALAATALAEGKNWISLTVLKRNEAARSFYEALGMTQVEVDFFAMGKSALSRL